MPFDKDEWEAWREHPLTYWFMETYLAGKVAEAKQTFIEYAWGKREVDPIYHASLFERSQTLEQIKTLTYEDLGLD